MLDAAVAPEGNPPATNATKNGNIAEGLTTRVDELEEENKRLRLAISDLQRRMESCICSKLKAALRAQDKRFQLLVEGVASCAGCEAKIDEAWARVPLHIEEKDIPL